MSRYNFPAIARERAAGTPWSAIAPRYGVKAPTIRGAFSRWQSKRQRPSGTLCGRRSVPAKLRTRARKRRRGWK